MKNVKVVHLHAVLNPEICTAINFSLVGRCAPTMMLIRRILFIVKSITFWDVTSCSPTEIYWRSLLPESYSLFSSRIIDSEEGGIAFFRNHIELYRTTWRHIPEASSFIVASLITSNQSLFILFY
jgi:hypothetical protein